MTLKQTPRKLCAFIYEVIEQIGKKHPEGRSLFLDDEYEIDGKDYQLKVWIICIQHPTKLPAFSATVDEAIDVNSGEDHSALVQKYLNMRLPVNVY